MLYMQPDISFHQELLDELKPVMNPTKNFGNNSVAYPPLDNLEKEYEKESAM